MPYPSEFVYDPLEWCRDDLIIEADRYEEEQNWLSRTIDKIENHELQVALNVWNRLRILQIAADKRGAAKWTRDKIAIALEGARRQVHALGGECNAGQE